MHKKIRQVKDNTVKIIYYNIIVFGISFLYIILITGCSQHKQTTLETSIVSQTQSQEKYNEYLLLMTEKQRIKFFNCQNDTEKQNFLQAEGLECYKEIQSKLTLGITPYRVQELLGNPWLKDVTFHDTGKEIRWIYNDFNGYKTISYILIFQNDELTSWSLLE